MTSSRIQLCNMCPQNGFWLTGSVTPANRMLADLVVVWALLRPHRQCNVARGIGRRSICCLGQLAKVPGTSADAMLGNVPFSHTGFSWNSSRVAFLRTPCVHDAAPLSKPRIAGVAVGVEPNVPSVLVAPVAERARQPTQSTADAQLSGGSGSGGGGGGGGCRTRRRSKRCQPNNR